MSLSHDVNEEIFIFAEVFAVLHADAESNYTAHVIVIYEIRMQGKKSVFFAFSCR